MKVGGVGAVGPVGFDPRRGGSDTAGTVTAGAEGEKGLANVSRGVAGARRHEGASAAGSSDWTANIDPREVVEIVDGLNQALKAAEKRLQFLVHETTGRIYVKVINAETEEVIREIPPEKILDLVGRIMELVGLIVDEKV